MEALKKKASEDKSAGLENDLALRALKAAEARQKMDPEKRERAKMRWKKAFRSVMSPAAIIKRAMGNFGKAKVTKSQTVVSRVEKVEEENGKIDNRLRQVEKVREWRKDEEGRQGRSLGSSSQLTQRHVTHSQLGSHHSFSRSKKSGCAGRPRPSSSGRRRREY